MNITVYLGAGFGNDRRLTETARQFGTWIGTAGHTLVYGGSKSGLMGVLAQSVLAAGGKVIGVSLSFLSNGACSAKTSPNSSSPRTWPSAVRR